MSGGTFVLLLLFQFFDGYYSFMFSLYLLVFWHCVFLQMYSFTSVFQSAGIQLLLIFCVFIDLLYFTDFQFFFNLLFAGFFFFFSTLTCFTIGLFGFWNNILKKNILCFPILYFIDLSLIFIISFCSFKCAWFLFFWPIGLNLMYLHQAFLFSDNYIQSYVFPSRFSLGAYHTFCNTQLSFYFAIAVHNSTFDFLFNSWVM